MTTTSEDEQQVYYFPMSFAQQRLWLFQQMQPDSCTYNITGALRLTGKLNVQQLDYALMHIVQRHEVLRTTFVEYQSEVSQWVHPEVTVKLEQKEIVTGELPDKLKQCHQHAADLAAHVFDLKKAPLIKLQLVKLSEDDYVLLSVVHHIISDGWSMGVFAKELMAFYKNGQNSGLPELELQYGDYALWQREWFAGERRETQIKYWQKQLSGAPPLLALPTDFTRPVEQSYRGATVTRQCSVQTTKALRALAAKEGVTLNMFFLATYFVLLYRYSGDQDLLVGSPVANRNQHELEALIGFFANTLIIRAELTPHSHFRQFLQQIKRTTIAAYEHQDCPFEQLIDVLKPERTLSYAPLIQALFTFQSAGDQTLELADVKISQLQLERSNAQFDLALMAAENNVSIDFEFSYANDLFEPGTIEIMADHFITLCEQVVANPELTLAVIPLMAANEYRSTILAWNTSQQVKQKQDHIMAAIEHQTALTPDAIAVECNQRQLSYQTLSDQSAQMAQQLIQQGVKTGDLVGLCVERGVDLLLVMFAIIKAGATYVPMDPQYPEQRLKLMVTAANLKHIISQKKIAAQLKPISTHSTKLYLVEDLLAADVIDTQLPKISAEQLIYMIFTSGSTGVPKGAGVQHKSFANLVLNWFVPEYNLQEAHSTLLCTSASFDLTQKNFFAPLVFGGTLHLYPQQEYDPAKLVRLIDQHKIGWINTTPSAFYPLTDIVTSQPESMASLRQVFLGGEPIVLARMQPWLDYAKQRTLIANTYGPTECTDVCMYFNINAVDDYLGKTVPLGKAINNVKLYVLDEALNPLPDGVPGELCIGGFAVGVGYLNDRQGTAEKFLPDAFSVEAGARLYKTGDRVRFTKKRGFEFIGRNDHQVKIRGFRIDLEEIELALNAHPDIKESIVVAAENEASDKSLVAYVVAEQEEVEISLLRDFIGEQLPHYMLPQHWLILESLPLTPSGKVNRLALPAITDQKPAHIQLTPPENDIEQKVLEIWQQVLEVSAISTCQNFFELGGHSLNATQIVSRMQQVFSLEVPMRVIFEQPSIKQQAEWILTAQFETLDDAEQNALLNELSELSDDELVCYRQLNSE